MSRFSVRANRPTRRTRPRGADFAEGNALLAPSVTRRVIADYAKQPSRPKKTAVLDRLTDRESEVLRLIATGMSNAEIAAMLFLGEGTVKTHVSHVLAKLDLRARV